MKQRFTLDGSAALERCLEAVCAAVADAVRTVVPPAKLEAVVLGGGYGRGEGGVLRTAAGDRPYNDLEFYIFMLGNRLLNERDYAERLHQLGEDLSPNAGLHVEFKVESAARLRRAPVSMFTYDLVSGHRLVCGNAGLFAGCNRHLDARNIPASEATRLLFNRCTGLLLAREMLQRQPFGETESDFARRNVAKAQLAAGDALLALCGEYRWSCLERQARLPRLRRRLELLAAEFDRIVAQHAAGVAFKLHPARGGLGRDALQAAHAEVADLCRRLWLYIESRRLNCRFASMRDYAFHPARKCPESSGWKNLLLNVRTFGPRAAFDPMSARYPRERLLNALALLLWAPETPAAPECTRKLQHCLRSPANDWPGLVRAYKNVWPIYG